MDYMLENLGDERFQQVCQALVAREYPSAQCYPVGQRDGGRDVTASRPHEDKKKIVVFQVKFVRSPAALPDRNKWLVEVLKQEAPKIKRLISKGASEFKLLTNVQGTAFPDSGSIDSVQAILDEFIEIPSSCWWRDDINRRLDDSWSIKWAYPDILFAGDILGHLVENGFSEEKERRSSAIKAFLRDQFNRETEVKFKQVQLQNNILDLFVDVPVEIRAADAQKQLFRQYWRGALRMHGFESGRRFHIAGEERAGIGAATFLLHRTSQKHYPRIVIEGAPGQGKSTIVQYVCQIHRLKLLNEAVSDPRIPDEHRNHPAKLPLKVDCRDLSLWLTKRDPFSAEDDGEPPKNWHRSLEAFLAAQIAHGSGGCEFSVSDLHALLRVSEVLAVFDGLDEVADIGRRADVVDQIQKGTIRLSETACSVQTIVTSRPAAFANSPGLPEDKFLHLSLSAIGKSHIEEYAAKWLKAKRLDNRESASVMKILRDKLEQPHLRQLSRNTMQLAILLSLIQTRGGSLPDKRTSLYDSYVELFFNRESEKSSIVRDHRDLLVDIHRHVAWVLHAESQTKAGSGSIGVERLKQLVCAFLRNEGRDPSIADQLFAGMIERVVALVSRVEGTFEFEVQPLREYFAARHLYQTAPYSPSGDAKKGTLPDRFDALARDFYWLNVTRFYAGCYSKGELASLVDRIDELCKDSEHKYTSHPQALAGTLLADWVFSQSPRAMRQVVSMIVSPISLRRVAYGSTSGGRDEVLVLPKGNGAEELIDCCFDALKVGGAIDYEWSLMELIKANAPREKINELWIEQVRSASLSQRTRWVERGLFLGALPLASEAVLREILDDDVGQRLPTLLRAGHSTFIESDKEYFQVVVDRFLNRVSTHLPRVSKGLLEQFNLLTSSSLYGLVFGSDESESLAHLADKYLHGGGRNLDIDLVGPSGKAGGVYEQCREFVEFSQPLVHRSAVEWATQLSLWDDIVECGRRIFGNRLAFRMLAVTSAGVRSREKLGAGSTNLFDNSISLCQRVRSARIRGGNHPWWGEQISSCKSEDVFFLLLVLFSWAGKTVVEKYSEVIDGLLVDLSNEQWVELHAALGECGRSFLSARQSDSIKLGQFSEGISDRFVVLLAKRCRNFEDVDGFWARMKGYTGDDSVVLEYCQYLALRVSISAADRWNYCFPIIERTYVSGVLSDRYFGHRLATLLKGAEMPPELAKEVLRKADRYPAEMIAIAERVCRAGLSKLIVPVGEVAERDGWFRSEMG